MKTITLLTVAAFAPGLLAQAPLPRPAHPPLPPTVSVATTSAPQVMPEKAIRPANARSAATPGPAPSRPRGSRQPTTTASPALATEVLFDRPVSQGPLWAMGHDWKASFDGRGCTFIPFFGSQAPRNFPLRIELANVTVGEEVQPLSDGEPIATANQVRTPRGAVWEVIDTRLRAVEQSFVFASLPNRGAVAVELAFTSDLACSADAAGLTFANEFGTVTYQHAIAKDAAGASLPLAIVWNGTKARIEIPAAFVARAQLPLVLDPVLQVNPGYAPFQTQLQRSPDVATIQSLGLSCVVWKRQWSVLDQDCYATVIGNDLTQATTLLQIDFTGNSWATPMIAGCNFAQNFLIVSEVDLGSSAWIGGRLVSAIGVLSAQIDIERGGTVGLAGNNYRPDVGCDPYPNTAAYYTVVFEHQTAVGNHDIYCKQLYQDGSLRTFLPTLIDNSSANESHPSISKSNRTGNWFVAYQRTFNAIDEDLVGAQLTWWGALALGPYTITYTSDNDLLPDVSSPAVIDGATYAMVVWQRDVNGSSDNNIICWVQNAGGLPMVSIDLSQTEGAGLAQYWNQILPNTDSDGIRFAVGYTEQWAGLYDYDTRVSTLAYLPATGTLRLDEERVFLGSSGNDEYWTRMCADFSGGGATSARYVVVSASYGSNDIQVFAYGGYQPGQFFTTVPNQCGSLSIAATGTPAVGNPVTFTVGNGPLSGTILGFPGTIPLNALGCNCVQGVVNGLYLGNPLVWTIPANPAYVGIVLSVQGWTVVGSQCLGFVDLSNTIDFTIR